MQVYQNNIYTEYNNNKHKNFSKKREVNFNIEKSLNKSSSRMLRKKLHDLEKAPAPILNIKGAKSKIECWFDSNSNNNGNKYKEYSMKSTFSNKSNGQKKTKKIRGVNKAAENEESGECQKVIFRTQRRRQQGAKRRIELLYPENGKIKLRIM